MAITSAAESSNIVGITLRGRSNYESWAFSFQAAARTLGVWEFFQGQKYVEKEKSRSNFDMCDDLVSKETLDQNAATRQLLIMQKWLIELQTYLWNPSLVVKAMTLMRQSVDPLIVNSLCSFEDPHEVWVDFQGRFGLKRAEAVEQADQALNSIVKKNFDDPEEYTNAVWYARARLATVSGQSSAQKSK